MKTSLDKLIKFIKLEADRGYDNKAVVGGLEKIFSSWEAEARAENVPDELIQAVGARLRDYSQLTPASRSDMLHGLWRRIQRSSGVNLPSLPAAPDRIREGESRPEARTRPSQRPRREMPQLEQPAQEPISQRPGQGQDSHAAQKDRRKSPRQPDRQQRSDSSQEQSGQSRERFKQPYRPAGEARQSSTEQQISPPTPQKATPDEPEIQIPIPPGQLLAESRPEVTGETPKITEIEASPLKIPAKPPLASETLRQTPGRISTLARAPARRTPRPQLEGAPAALNAPVTVLPGVGPRHGETIARLGLHTLGDMLYFFPRRYLDYSQLRPINRLFYGEVVTVLGMIDSVSSRPARSGKMQLVEVVVSDGSGALRVTWFNQPWLAKRLHKGMYVSLSGKIEQYLGRLAMNNPELEQIDQEHLHTNRIVPVYSLTGNITQRWLRGLMHRVISYWSSRVQDPLPERICDSASLLDLPTALLQVHFPDSWEMLDAARYRLAFDEIFLLQMGVLRQKRSWQERTARVFPCEPAWLENQLARLPYTLTGAQQKSIQDILNDLASGRPMNRLLQGDVGAGKTVVAALAMALLAQHGAQSALMAPTSILAEQHFRNLRQLLCGAAEPQAETALLQVSEIRLLVGATPESEKEEIRVGLETGQIKIVIGTHALIEDPINFADLELAVIDEQHRFGVQQRSTLRSKGSNPHLLVMTATPIPRSLALTVYGDLDLSILDELPPGRQPITTLVFFPLERERAYALIRNEVDQGHQAFIIYPLVEESENSEALAAVEDHARLHKEIFPKYRLGLLHGRMKAEDKDSVMAEFRDGQVQILVSTSVVEVGVDVPNATAMLIEGANHFGLAQLHQFRGRIGRGQDPSICMLIPDNADDVENERLSAMAETNDGFILAERDLDQRGPGQFLGTRQSGYHSELRLASLSDIHLIEQARRQAQQIFSSDPDLELAEHKILAAAIARFWDEGQGDIS